MKVITVNHHGKLSSSSSQFACWQWDSCSRRQLQDTCCFPSSGLCNTRRSRTTTEIPLFSAKMPLGKRPRGDNSIVSCWQQRSGPSPKRKGGSKHLRNVFTLQCHETHVTMSTSWKRAHFERPFDNCWSTHASRRGYAPVELCSARKSRPSFAVLASSTSQRWSMMRDNAHHIGTVMMAKNLPNRSFLLSRFVLTTSLQLLEARAACTGKEGLHPWTKKSFLLCNCNSYCRICNEHHQFGILFSFRRTSDHLQSSLIPSCHPGKFATITPLRLS